MKLPKLRKLKANEIVQQGDYTYSILGYTLSERAIGHYAGDYDLKFYRPVKK